MNGQAGCELVSEKSKVDDGGVNHIMRPPADGGCGFELVIDMPAVRFQGQNNSVAGKVSIGLLCVGVSNPQGGIARDVGRHRWCASDRHVPNLSSEHSYF